MEIKSTKSRGRLFIENFIIYGVGGTINRIIPLIMLPIVTRLYPDSSYLGLNNNVNTMASFAAQVAILGIYDAMYRYYFEKEDAEYRREVTSSALRIVMASGAVMMILLMLLRRQVATLVFADAQYTNLVLIGAVTVFMTTVNSIIAAPTRMRNQRSRYLVINFFSSIISYSMAIPLLLRGAYEIAMPLSTMTSAILIGTVFAICNHAEFSFSSGTRKCAAQLFRFGIPCMPGFIFYWLMNSVQTILITNIIGLAAAGIYSVGAKIATISQLIYTAFASGWQYFAFSTMKDKDQVQLMTKVFDYLGGISFFAVCVIVLIAHPIFALLFEPEYAEGAWVVPALFLTPLMQMLYQTIGSQFLVVKKPGIGTIILLFGAITALTVSFVFIPVIGIRGSALAGLMGYLVTLIVTVTVLLKMKLIEVPGRLCVSALIAMCTVLLFTLQVNSALYTVAAALGICCIAVFYLKDGRKIVRSIFKL